MKTRPKVSRPTPRRYAWVSAAGGCWSVSLLEYEQLWAAADDDEAREINPEPASLGGGGGFWA